ncbi:glycosyltransferase [Streptosporangium sandarakinum]|uniref:glycosyltransferase family 2 protein n=1 Tax=Streptosporangium sandarakinum TaxID=1260955 RepID=UPI003D8AB1B0
MEGRKAEEVIEEPATRVFARPPSTPAAPPGHPAETGTSGTPERSPDDEKTPDHVEPPGEGEPSDGGTASEKPSDRTAASEKPSDRTTVAGEPSDAADSDRTAGGAAPDRTDGEKDESPPWPVWRALRNEDFAGVGDETGDGVPDADGPAGDGPAGEGPADGPSTDDEATDGPSGDDETADGPSTDDEAIDGPSGDDETAHGPSDGGESADEDEIEILLEDADEDAGASPGDEDAESGKADDAPPRTPSGDASPEDESDDSDEGDAPGEKAGEDEGDEELVVVALPIEDDDATVSWRIPADLLSGQARGSSVPSAGSSTSPAAGSVRTATRTAVRTADPSLSVVLAGDSMDSRARLTATVAALRAQDPAPEEIILVVDQCPELASWAETELAGVTVLPGREAGGSAAARNLGLANAHGDVIAFLDEGSLPEPGWSASLLAAYADDDVVAVRGRVTPRWSAGRPDWFPTELSWVLGVPCTGSPDETEEIDDLYGGALSFRRRTLTEAGGFPETLDRRAGDAAAEPAGGTATELRSRLRELAPEAKLVHEPSAAVRLNVPPRRARLSYFLARCFAEGRSQAGVPQRASGREGALAHLAPVRAGLPRAIFRAVTFTGPVDVKGWKALMVMLLGLLTVNAGYVARRLRTTRTEGTARQVNTLTWFVSRTSLPLASILWGLSLRGVHLDGMTDLGLITVMPVTFWLAIAVMVIGFVCLLGDREALELWHAGYVLVLIAVLHATPALLYPSLRYSWAWKHVSVIDYLIRHGATDPDVTPLSAYHQWPGFFSFFALMTRAAGLENALGIAVWGPAVFNVALLLPLLLLWRTVTRNRQLVWGAVWVYFSCSWVGQDYFSPQATTLVLYLIVLSVVVRRFRRGPIRAGDDPEALGAEPPPVSDTRTRLVWSCLLFVVVLGIASSHQLTPLVLTAALFSLVLLRRHRNVGILVVTGLVVAGWDLLAARQLLEERFGDIVESLGDAGGNLDDGLIALGDASPGQVIVAYADRALSAGLWLLAFAGAYKRRHLLRRAWLPLVAIGLSPLLFLAGGSYGGEIVFRVYLFTLPLTAFLAAALFLPARREWIRLAVLPLVFLLMVTGFFFGNYGKEQTNYFTSAETALVQAVYKVAPNGSQIVAPTFVLPGAYDYYERYDHTWLDELPPTRTAVKNLPDYVPTLPEMIKDPIPSLTSLMSRLPPGGKAYLIINRAQKAATETAGIFPKGTVDRIDKGAAASDRFKLLLRTSGGVVYELVPEKSK